MSKYTYHQVYSYLELAPESLTQFRNILYPFDAGTWLCTFLSLLLMTLALAIVAIYDRDALHEKVPNQYSFYTFNDGLS